MSENLNPQDESEKSSKYVPSTSSDNTINYGHHDTYGETNVNQVNIEGNIALQKYNLPSNVYWLDAITEYQSMKRELSRVSRKTTNPSKVEEGQAESDEFNLDEFLHGMNQAHELNGSKRKNLGVSWKDLHVEVNFNFNDYC